MSPCTALCKHWHQNVLSIDAWPRVAAAVVFFGASAGGLYLLNAGVLSSFGRECGFLLIGFLSFRAKHGYVCVESRAYVTN